MLGKFFRDVLIPGEIRGYYTLPYIIASVTVTRFELTVTFIQLQGTKTTILSSTTRIIEADATSSYEIRLGELLKELLPNQTAYDELRVVLPSGSAVYKELTLPFKEDEKIKAIVAYEIEQYIPFSLSEVVIDYIKTESLPNGHTTLLVAAVKREFIEKFLEPFKTADRIPTHLTIDLFDLYKLYLADPTFKTLKQTVVLLLVEPSITSLAIIIDNRLVLIRTLANGLGGWIKEAAQETGLNISQVQQKFLRFGLNDATDSVYTTTIQKTGENFCNEVMFTLQSIHERLALPLTKNEIIVMAGRGSEISGMKEFVGSCTKLQTMTLSIDPLFNTSILKKQKNVVIDAQQLVSIAAGYGARVGSQYNFAQGGLGRHDIGKIYKQIGTTLVLCFAILSVLWGGMYYHIYSLRRKAESYEREAVQILKDRQLIKPTGKKRLREALDLAQDTLRSQEQVWLAFSTQTRFSFLYYLHELTKAVDKKGTGLVLQKITLNSREMSLDGSVKDFEALTAFEKQLQASGLFAHIPSMQTPKFSTGPLTLHFSKG